MTITIKKNSKMKTIKLNKNGKARQPKLKNRITMTKQYNGLYTVTHMTFCNGNTVNHMIRTDLTRDEAKQLKAELLDL